jgi:nucleoside-diphosphate-sugar epimerase
VNHLLCFGFGFTAQHLARLLPRDQWRLTGTTRSREGLAAIAEQNVEGFVFQEMQTIPASVTHILASIPPGDKGDPVVLKFANQLARTFSWVAYLSTTGVYGDRQGGWVDEDSQLNPTSNRARRRVLAELQWQPFKAHVFRLPGIYGPGRSQLDAVRDGTARRIVKPGQIFSRIHVQDIADILAASIAKPNPGRIYNVADDEACPPQDVVAYAAELLGLTPPPEVPFESAHLSPMARSFYDDSKRVSNARIKQELGYQLKYPNYRLGLRALLHSQQAPRLAAPLGWNDDRNNLKLHLPARPN